MMHFARFAGFDHQTGLHPQALAHQLVVHGGGRQQSGHRDPVRPLFAVRQDQDRVVLQHCLGRGPAHFLDRHREAVGPGADVPGRVDGRRAECAVECDFDRANLAQILVGQDRLRDFEALMRSRLAPEQVGARADHRHQAHHQFLADRIDRRIGNLREILLEIIVKEAGARTQHRDRRVGAHRAHRILAVRRHRFEEAGEILLRIAEGLLAFEERGLRAGNFRQFGLDMREVFQLVLRAVEPFLIRMLGGELGLQLVILDDAAFLEVDQQHLARLEAPFAHDLLFLDRKHAAFAREDHMPVLRHAIARGAQPVAVERGADLAPVGEADRGGPVPGLHQCGMVFVEGAAARLHQIVLGPGFRDQHHHRMGERISARQQQFERIVETGRVRLAMRDQRPHLVEIDAEEIALHRAAARFHPVHVSAHRVDLAIMGGEAIGVGEPPAGEGVGGEALVNQTEGGGASLVAQIVVEATHLIGQQQPLVDDGAAGKARNIGLRQSGQVVLFGQLLERVQRLLADDDQLALESVLIGAGLAARDHALAHHRHGIDDRLAQPVERARHVAPAEHALAFLGDEFLELFDDEAGRFLVLRQEALRDRIMARHRQFDAVLVRPAAEQRVRDLQQNARAIAQQRIGADRAAMVQIGEDFESAHDDRMAFPARDMRHHADAAGIVFVARIVEPVGGRRETGGRHLLRHSRPSSRSDAQDDGALRDSTVRAAPHAALPKCREEPL